MADRRSLFKIGAFFAVTLAVLAGLVIFFGHAPDLFTNKASYTVLFPEAPGIGAGTPIRKSGVRIGEVTGLDLDPVSGQVRVAIQVDRKYLPRKTEDAIITKGLLSGDAAVDFLPHMADESSPYHPGEEYPPGSEILGVPPITPRSLLTPASGIIAQAQQSLDRIVKAFEKLEKLERIGPKMETALDEFTQLARDARLFIPDLRKTNDKLQNLLGSDAPNAPNLPIDRIAAQPPQPPDQPTVKALIRDLQDLVRSVRPAVEEIRTTIRRLEPELAGTVKSARQSFDSINDVLTPENRKLFAELLRNINGIANSVVKVTATLGVLLDDADRTLKNIDAKVTSFGELIVDVRSLTKPLSMKSESIVASVSEAADQLGKTLAEVRQLLQMFGSRNGTLQKLMTDPAVYQSLDEAAASLARVMCRVEKISRDLEVFSDKVARRPELIGLGGMIHPSSGLKYAPTAGLPAYRPDWPPALPARDPPPDWLLPPSQPPPAPQPPSASPELSTTPVHRPSQPSEPPDLSTTPVQRPSPPMQTTLPPVQTTLPPVQGYPPR